MNTEQGRSYSLSPSPLSLSLSLPSPLPLTYSSSASFPLSSLPPPRITIETNSNVVFPSTNDPFTPSHSNSNQNNTNYPLHMNSNDDTNHNLKKSITMNAISISTTPSLYHISSNCQTPNNQINNNNNNYFTNTTHDECVPASQTISVGSTPVAASGTPHSWASPDTRYYSDDSVSRSGCPTPTSDLPDWAKNAVWSVEDESTPRIPRSVYEHTLCEQMDETTALAMYTSLIENFPRNPLSGHSPLPIPQLSVSPTIPRETSSPPSVRHQKIPNGAGNRIRRDREWEALFASPMNDVPIQDQISSLLQQQQLQLHQQQQLQKSQSPNFILPQQPHSDPLVPRQNQNLPPRPYSQQPYNTLLQRPPSQPRPKSQTPTFNY